MSNFLKNSPTKDQKEETFDFYNKRVLQIEEDKWIMYFGGASNQKGFGAAFS